MPSRFAIDLAGYPKDADLSIVPLSNEADDMIHFHPYNDGSSNSSDSGLITPPSLTSDLPHISGLAVEGSPSSIGPAAGLIDDKPVPQKLPSSPPSSPVPDPTTDAITLREQVTIIPDQTPYTGSKWAVYKAWRIFMGSRQAVIVKFAPDESRETIMVEHSNRLRALESEHVQAPIYHGLYWRSPIPDAFAQASSEAAFGSRFALSVWMMMLEDVGSPCDTNWFEFEMEDK